MMYQLFLLIIGVAILFTFIILAMFWLPLAYAFVAAFMTL